MSNGWESLAESGRRTYWDANLDTFQFSKFPGLDVEVRIVTEPFMYQTHWYYTELVDAWLHANDIETLKKKYNGKLNGKTGPRKRSFECVDFDHDTKRSNMCDCLLCTTYSQFTPYADRTVLFQAYWRIPSSTNPALRTWQKVQVFSFNKAALGKLQTVTRQQGNDIASPQAGYSIFVTYNPNQGAATWSVTFSRREALPPNFVNAAQAAAVDFRAIYERGNPQDLAQHLSKIGYARLLDGSYTPPPQFAGGAPQGGYTPQGMYPGQQQGGYPGQGHGGHGYPGQHGGFQQPGFGGGAQPGFGGAHGGFGGAPQAGFGAPEAAPGFGPTTAGGYDDFGAPQGGFGGSPGFEPGFDQGAGGFEAGGFEQAPGGFEAGGFEQAPGGFDGGFGGGASQGGFGFESDGFSAQSAVAGQGGFGGQLPPLPGARPAPPTRPSAPPPPSRPAAPGAARPAAPGAPGAPRPVPPRPAPPVPGQRPMPPRG